MKDFSHFIADDYMKNVRKGPGLVHAKNGLGLYKNLLKWYTTVDNITPEKLHDMGKQVFLNSLKART